MKKNILVIISAFLSGYFAKKFVGDNFSLADYDSLVISLVCLLIAVGLSLKRLPKFKPEPSK
ncbi:hypothetical protein A3A66_03220 [Microgenomates group bacterium RIFCSPLOWO2_01_FULL_46_13]|nr:MAG: hypothetical protein A2783_04785 [Microgenomates group bacterium RIFCSPHIGHO2_01_FULL_45_11]OGV94163.1 MAG: hypothetical protein A3A66_03220 [Microgenomates group bacterium RIFCSPLOWO2_01_FULL_46_13]